MDVYRERERLRVVLLFIGEDFPFPGVLFVRYVFSPDSNFIDDLNSLNGDF